MDPPARNWTRGLHLSLVRTLTRRYYLHFTLTNVLYLSVIHLRALNDAIDRLIDWSTDGSIDWLIVSPRLFIIARIEYRRIVLTSSPSALRWRGKRANDLRPPSSTWKSIASRRTTSSWRSGRCSTISTTWPRGSNSRGPQSASISTPVGFS